MKRFFTIFGLLALIGWSGVSNGQSQAYNLIDSIQLPWVIDKYDGLTANNQNLFVLSSTRDSIYIYNVNTKSLINTQFIENGGHTHGRPVFRNGKIFVARNNQTTIGVYDASNVNNLSFVEDKTNATGWFNEQPEDSTYLFWTAHWAQKIQIMNISGSTISLNQYVSVNGNSGNPARFGNYLYVPNQYNQSVRIDMTDPNNCTVTNFGNTQSTAAFVSNNGYVLEDYSINVSNNANKNVKIYNGSTGVLLDTKSNCYIVKTLPNENLCIIGDYSDGITKLYDISSGSFVFVKNLWASSTEGKMCYNTNYIYKLFNSKIYIYSRFSCSNSVSNDTITYFVSSPEFQSNSPKIVFENTDSLTTQVGGCDSIVNHYSKFVYNPTYCTVTDTNYVTINDTTFISVTDTLIIDAILTGVTPPNNLNTMKIYPNPASTHIYINNGDYTLMNGYTITIENNLSQVVFSSLINQAEFYIDLSTWSGNGLYIVKIFDNSSNVIETKKIIIQ